MATVTGTAAAGADVASKVDAGRTRLAENFEMFLTLLTTQLKNQDPMSPMDGNQFTQQLVQMTSVEQQLLTNDLLKSIAGQGNDDFGKAVDMIGTDISSDWPQRSLGPDGASWGYDLGKDAQNVTLKIRNEAGSIVWTGAGDGKSKGAHEVNWDGKVNGSRVPEGVYTLEVEASDNNATGIKSRVFMEGIVTGVEQKDGAVMLSVGKTLLPLSAIQSVRLPMVTQTPTTPPDETDEAPLAKAA